ncbi:MAG: MMPL family transporter [Spirochaetes bacterium]|nr:MMPL family transporter [Spirochaetota bacterium]
MLVFAVTADNGDVLNPAALAIRLMSPGGVTPDARHIDEFHARLSGTRYAQNLVVSANGRMLISYFQTENMESFKEFMADVDNITAAVRAAGLTPYVTGTIPLNVRTEFHLSHDAAPDLLAALIGIPLDMTTIMGSNITIGVGVDSAIYLVIQFRRELGRAPLDPAHALSDTLAAMGQPVLLSSFSIIVEMLVLFTLLATTGGTLLKLPTILALDVRFRIARRQRRRAAGPSA